MHSLRRTADLLDKRLEAWRSVISQQDVSTTIDENLEELWNRELRLSDDYVVSFGFAISEVLTARGRLLDMLEVIEQCWPDRGFWCEIRRSNSTRRILSGIWFWLLRSQVLQNKLVFDDLNRLLGPADEQTDDEESIPELDVVYAYHDAKARLRALRELGDTLIQEEQIDRIASHVPRSHFSLEREKIEWLAREYIFNERLFSWSQGPESRLRRQRYSFIYEQANLDDLELDDAVRTYLQSTVRFLELEQAISEDVVKIISRVALFVQTFGYEHFVQDVTQDGGQWGPSSGVGSREMINLVPGQKTAAACHRIVLAIARGRNERSRGSLKNVMRSLRAHLRQCGEITKIAIVTTDVWDKESFEESMNDIAEYQHQGTKFLFLLINGRRLIEMDLSFT